MGDEKCGLELLCAANRKLVHCEKCKSFFENMKLVKRVEVYFNKAIFQLLFGDNGLIVKINGENGILWNRFIGTHTE